MIYKTQHRKKRLKRFPHKNIQLYINVREYRRAIKNGRMSVRVFQYLAFCVILCVVLFVSVRSDFRIVMSVTISD
jgi:hypothetical protein